MTDPAIVEAAGRLTRAQRELFSVLIPLEHSNNENSRDHRGFLYETSTTGRRGRLISCGALYRRGFVQSESHTPTARAYEKPWHREGYVWLTPRGIAVFQYLQECLDA